MTVEEVRGNMEGEDRNYDNFPVGMRVLAVDDDPICLKLLEGLLRKCQYHATTTNQARMALKMLRENRDRFDLVISDVHMPDMDGFKLLELVGLEMDLPVIMLSVNSDPKLVMKGVTHGACDYLVKPIRIEELRNIWQHVIRKKKSDPKKPSKSADQDKSLPGGEGGQGGNAQAGNPDQNEKLNKRRKDDESEAEDNEQDHDDSSTQKKPRVVWSIELHRKFVAAVNQLGIEKAVPKRILDMMNVEGLTRENVASHLQKYRLYLKRISSVASQKAYMVAAIGGKDSAYMRAGSLDGFGDFRTLTGPGRYANPAFTSYTQAAMLGRLNSPAGVGLRNVASSALVQPSLGPSISNSIGTVGKLHPLVSPATQNATLFQGVPSLLELDQLQQNKCTISVRDYNPLDDSAILGAVSTFNNTRPVAANSNNSAGIIPNKDLVTQRNSLQPSTAGFVNHSSVNLNTFNNEPFDLDIGDPTTFSDRNRHNGDWSGAVQLSKFHSNPLSPNESLGQGRLPATHTRGTTSSTGPHLPILPLDFPSTNAVSVSLEDSRVGGHGQEALGGGTQSMNLGPQQRWVENKQNYSHNSSNTVGPLHLPVPANGSTVGPLGKSIGENGFDNRIDLSLTGRSSVSASTFVQQADIDRPTTDTRSRSGGDCILGQTKSPGAATYGPQSYDSLDDLMNSLIKREQSGNIFDGEIPFDAYAFGSCI